MIASENLDAVINLKPIFETCSWQSTNLLSLSDDRHRQQVGGVSHLTNVRPLFTHRYVQCLSLQNRFTAIEES